jgi:hypothetical protein
MDRESCIAQRNNQNRPESSDCILLLQCATRPGHPSHARDQKRPRRRSAGGPGGGPRPRSTPRPGGCCAQRPDIAGEHCQGLERDQHGALNCLSGGRRLPAERRPSRASAISRLSRRAASRYRLSNGGVGEVLAMLHSEMQFGHTSVRAVTVKPTQLAL